MSTLESRYEQRVQELQDDPDALVKYVLDTVPYIREYTAAPAAPESKRRGALDSFITVDTTTNKHSVLENYLAEVELDPEAQVRALGSNKKNVRRAATLTEGMTCEKCDTPYVHDKAQAQLICQKCGACTPYMEMSTANMSFDDQMSLQPPTSCAYQRKNHMSEWLSALQARQSTVIPQEVLDAVAAELKKMRITARGDITPAIVRQHLRKLRLNRWYEHTNAITNALHGQPAPVLPEELEFKLKSMFEELQPAFDECVKTVAPTRKNFLSYAFTIRKLLELLGEDEFIEHFPLLRSTHKIFVMDSIWKCCCARLRWQFVPTV